MYIVPPGGGGIQNNIHPWLEPNRNFYIGFGCWMVLPTGTGRVRLSVSLLGFVIVSTYILRIYKYRHIARVFPIWKDPSFDHVQSFIGSSTSYLLPS